MFILKLAIVPVILYLLYWFVIWNLHKYAVAPLPKKQSGMIADDVIKKLESGYEYEMVDLSFIADELRRTKVIIKTHSTSYDKMILDFGGKIFFTLRTTPVRVCYRATKKYDADYETDDYALSLKDTIRVTKAVKSRIKEEFHKKEEKKQQELETIITDVMTDRI